MLGILLIAITVANVDQPFPRIAPLQHAPTVLLALAAPPVLVRWPMSDRAVAATLVFLLLHTFAGRWTYSNVPYDLWTEALVGETLSKLLGLHRNEFDRLVHLGFGTLAIPVYTEAVRRYGRFDRRAALWSAFLFVGCVSALYEIFEWLLTIIAAPSMAADYNGQQGDPWDSQKDMAMALVGAAFSCLIMTRWKSRSSEQR